MNSAAATQNSESQRQKQQLSAHNHNGPAQIAVQNDNPKVAYPIKDLSSAFDEVYHDNSSGGFIVQGDEVNRFQKSLLPQQLPNKYSSYQKTYLNQGPGY